MRARRPTDSSRRFRRRRAPDGLARRWCLSGATAARTSTTAWRYSYAGSARKFFQEWSGWASRRRLQPMLKVAKMWPRHFANISTYRRQPITNAVSAGLHSKIQAIKANARGFRSYLNYRTRILCFCGKLVLYPL